MSFLKPVFSSARGRYQSNVLPISLSNQNTVTHLFPSTFTVRAFMIPQKALWSRCPALSPPAAALWALPQGSCPASGRGVPAYWEPQWVTHTFHTQKGSQP